MNNQFINVNPAAIPLLRPSKRLPIIDPKTNKEKIFDTNNYNNTNMNNDNCNNSNNNGQNVTGNVQRRIVTFGLHKLPLMQKQKHKDETDINPIDNNKNSNDNSNNGISNPYSETLDETHIISSQTYDDEKGYEHSYHQQGCHGDDMIEATFDFLLLAERVMDNMIDDYNNEPTEHLVHRLTRNIQSIKTMIYNANNGNSNNRNSNNNNNNNNNVAMIMVDESCLAFIEFQFCVILAQIGFNWESLEFYHRIETQLWVNTLKQMKNVLTNQLRQIQIQFELNHKNGSLN